jgi:hypothetical protein
MAPRIFICHRSADPSLVERVMQLLVESTGVRGDQIRITGGTAQEIREAPVFVALITRDATPVLFEVGARWGADKKGFLVLGPDGTRDGLPASMSHWPAVQVASEADLDRFVQDVAQELKLTATGTEGFCIRCRLEIPLDTGRPYCIEDYEVWAQTQNWSHQDRFCHRCAKAHPATKAEPLCGSCAAELRAS